MHGNDSTKFTRQWVSRESNSHSATSDGMYDSENKIGNCNLGGIAEGSFTFSGG